MGHKKLYSEFVNGLMVAEFNSKVTMNNIKIWIQTDMRNIYFTVIIHLIIY